MMRNTLIIGEAGVNHNGDLDIARQLIDVAVYAGADIVKFQTFSADAIVTKNVEKAAYQKFTTGEQESHYDMIRKLELNRDAHIELLDYCTQNSIEFLSSPFDHDSVDLLMDLGLKRIKIPSGEITNLPYLEHIGKYRKPVILSTGMSTLGEISAAVNVLERAGTMRNEITILHCNTDYSTPMSDVNLMAMVTIQKELRLNVGYSDHTLGIEVPMAAVALGATIIEKHFTLDRSLDGPDHKASIEPSEFKDMVTSIRNIETALGKREKCPSKSEKMNLPIIRKSIVAAKRINAGEVLTTDNLCVKRPGTGISPMRWYKLIGQRAKKNYNQDDLI